MQVDARIFSVEQKEQQSEEMERNLIQHLSYAIKFPSLEMLKVNPRVPILNLLLLRECCKGFPVLYRRAFITVSDF